MARARTIKPSFFTNDVLASCSPLARLLFAGLWCLADREGKVEDRPQRIKVQILPYDDCDCDRLLDELFSAGFIHRFSTGEVNVIEIVNFSNHQNIHPKEAASNLPDFEENSKSREIKFLAAERNFLTGKEINKRKEKKEKKEKKREGKEGTELVAVTDERIAYGENKHVLLTAEQEQKLIEKFGAVPVGQAIDALDAWIESKHGKLAWFSKQYSSAFSYLNNRTCWLWEKISEPSATSRARSTAQSRWEAGRALTMKYLENGE